MLVITSSHFEFLSPSDEENNPIMMFYYTFYEGSDMCWGLTLMKKNQNLSFGKACPGMQGKV